MTPIVTVTTVITHDGESNNTFLTVSMPVSQGYVLVPVLCGPVIWQTKTPSQTHGAESHDSTSPVSKR